MTVTKLLQRKVVEITFNNAVGDTVDIIAGDESKKTIPNTGKADLTFPEDFTGTVSVSVQGSHPGSPADTGSISVS